jgi:type II secretory pathway component PulC
MSLCVASSSFSRLVPLALLVCACGGAPETQIASPVRASEKNPEPLQKLAPGTIARKAIVSVRDRGLGYFLQHIEVEPAFKEGVFSGWQVKALRERSDWAGYDLRVGDVVSRINGLPIERPNQATEALKACASAPEIVVTGERAGAPLSLRVAIVP